MFPEEGRSGALDLEDRVALTAAIDMIATRKAEGLVCYSLDRLAREITVQEAILAKVWEEAGGQVFTTDHGEVQRDDPDDPMRTAMRKMAGSWMSWTGAWSSPGYAAAAGSRPSGAGSPAVASATGSPQPTSNWCPIKPSGRSPAASIGCTEAACPSARSPTSSTPSRYQPSAAARGTRPPSPESFRGHRGHLLADHDSDGRHSSVRGHSRPATASRAAGAIRMRYPAQAQHSPQPSGAC
jgi:hypothetical protein